MTDNTKPEALRLANVCSNLTRYSMDAHLIAAELRRQHARIAELEAELEAVGAGGVQALSAAPAGPWSLGEMTGNWRDIDLPDHGAVMRIVWKMEDDDGRNAKLEAQARAVVAALNAASPTPPAEQQAQPGAVGRTGCTAGTDEECTRRGCATSCPAQQAAPKAAPAPQQEAQEPVAHDEDLLEQMYWDFDSQRKKTGEERLAFKGKMRSYASEFRRRSVGQMVFAQSVSDDMMNLADRLGSEFDDVDPRAWKHLLVYAPKAAPAPLSDDVVKDAALWHWLAEYLVGTRTDLDDEIVASKTVNDLRKLVEAALAAQGDKDA